MASQIQSRRSLSGVGHTDPCHQSRPPPPPRPRPVHTQCQGHNAGHKATPNNHNDNVTIMYKKVIKIVDVFVYELEMYLWIRFCAPIVRGRRVMTVLVV